MLILYVGFYFWQNIGVDTLNWMAIFIKIIKTLHEIKTNFFFKGIAELTVKLANCGGQKTKSENFFKKVF